MRLHRALHSLQSPSLGSPRFAEGSAFTVRLTCSPWQRQSQATLGSLGACVARLTPLARALRSPGTALASSATGGAHFVPSQKSSHPSAPRVRQPLFVTGSPCAANAAWAYLVLTEYCVRCFRHCRRSLRTPLDAATIDFHRRSFRALTPRTAGRPPAPARPDAALPGGAGRPQSSAARPARGSARGAAWRSPPGRPGRPGWN